MMTGGVISLVEPGSPAARAGILPGDVLLEVNGHPVRDVLDVQFYAAEERVTLRIRRGDQEILYPICRQYGHPLGLDFRSPTFDGIRRCQNNCEFCFVSQMPAGLRRSLYVRDDDYRYSVLYGSFVTLTQLSDADWDRLAEQRLSPLYVSVHATEPMLRRRLLGGRAIPDVLEQLDHLASLRIRVHAQIVLLPGVNDGPHLQRSLGDLVARYPAVQTIGVVPVGLTRYHRGGCRTYTAREAAHLIDDIAPMQAELRAAHGETIVHLADEWYLLAGREVPPDEMYDDYAQIENGIGLVRQLLDDSARVRFQRLPGARTYTLACGTLIAPLLRAAVADMRTHRSPEIEIVPIVNRLFGETVTVSGLLSGEDVVDALARRDRGDVVLLPRAMFSAGCGLEGGRAEGAAAGESALVTLDGVTLADISERLGRPVQVADRLGEVWC